MFALNVVDDVSSSVGGGLNTAGSGGDTTMCLGAAFGPTTDFMTVCFLLDCFVVGGAVFICGGGSVNGRVCG